MQGVRLYEGSLGDPTTSVYHSIQHRFINSKINARVRDGKSANIHHCLGESRKLQYLVDIDKLVNCDAVFAQSDALLRNKRIPVRRGLLGQGLIHFSVKPGMSALTSFINVLSRPVIRSTSLFLPFAFLFLRQSRQLSSTRKPCTLLILLCLSPRVILFFLFLVILNIIVNMSNTLSKLLPNRLKPLASLTTSPGATPAPIRSEVIQ